MSIEIDWCSLTPSIAEKLKERLNGVLISLPRPDYLGPITIQSISFGDAPPQVQVVDIRDISRGFRMADHINNSHPHQQDTSQTTTIDKRHDSHSQLSLQIHTRFTYDGNMRIQFSTSLLLNTPCQEFMSLPFKATVVGIGFDAELILAIEGDQSKLHLSLLQPPITNPCLDQDQNTFKRNLSLGNRILTHLFVETEVGNSDRHVLRNVGKVERFLTEITRTLICEELLYPVKSLFHSFFNKKKRFTLS